MARKWGWDELKPELLRPISDLGLSRRLETALKIRGIRFLAQACCLTDEDSGLTNNDLSMIKSPLVVMGLRPVLSKPYRVYEGLDVRTYSLAGLDLEDLAEALEKDKAFILEKMGGAVNPDAPKHSIYMGSLGFSAEKFHELATPLDEVLSTQTLRAVLMLDPAPLFLGQLLACSQEDFEGFSRRSSSELREAALFHGYVPGLLSSLKKELFDMPSVVFDGGTGDAFSKSFATAAQNHRDTFRQRLRAMARLTPSEADPSLASEVPVVNGPAAKPV